MDRIILSVFDVLGDFDIKRTTINGKGTPRCGTSKKIVRLNQSLWSSKF